VQAARRCFVIHISFVCASPRCLWLVVATLGVCCGIGVFLSPPTVQCQMGPGELCREIELRVGVGKIDEAWSAELSDRSVLCEFRSPVNACAG